MSEIFVTTYRNDDGMAFDDYWAAWDYEREVRYPNIQLFDEHGHRVNTIIDAYHYIVNTLEEAKLVEDAITEMENGGVYYSNKVVPGTLIRPYDYDNYIMAEPDKYKDETNVNNLAIKKLGKCD